jgi:hypothetical protein
VDGAQAIMSAGIQLLTPLLERHGFRFEPGASGASSGGAFSSGAFVRGNKRLRLHFRHSLGLVTYEVGEHSLPHSEFVRAQGAPHGANQYPGFSSEPLDGFHHLLHDLERFGEPFLSAPEATFVALSDWVAANPRPTGPTAV